MSKFFIITVDTESDNQWNTYNKQSTNNSKYIPRFQEVCCKYGFKPVYLVDYSMANDKYLVKYLNRKNVIENSEVGMHLHAWDTPPYYELFASTKERPYLIEYPSDIIYSKIQQLNLLLENKFERKMYSHRAGRWAINEEYIQILEKFQYEVDCSVTPGIDWSKQKGANDGGCDYSRERGEINYIFSTSMLEIPMTVDYIHGTSIRRNCGFHRMSKDILKSIIGNYVWLRPALFKNHDLIKLINVVEKKKYQYLEFMVHSSELMPGGSPYFKKKEDIENLYKNINELFNELKKRGYVGVTLKALNDIFRKGMMR